jgi:ParB family chromosome partitioning protein
LDPGAIDGTEIVHLAVDQIDPNPFQPRRQFDPASIASLADSLRQHGMIQPILVRAAGLRYQLIAGERRLRASIEAQLHEIPARVMNLDDQRVFELAMVENLQRDDLNAIEKASAFRDYLSRYSLTQDELAARLSLDRSTISNLIRLLELPEEILDSVRSDRISQGHARALLGIADEANRMTAYRRVVSEKLSVRQTEALVSTAFPASAKSRVRKDPAHAADPRIPHLLEMEQTLGQHLGTSVQIKTKVAESGHIIIDFRSREELLRLTNLLRVGAGLAVMPEPQSGAA